MLQLIPMRKYNQMIHKNYQVLNLIHLIFVMQVLLYFIQLINKLSLKQEILNLLHASILK